MKHYMLDTNMVSYVLKSNLNVIQHLTSKPISTICISAITAGELYYGLAKRPEAKALHKLVHEFLRSVDVLPWDSGIAEQYGLLRHRLTKQGNPLSGLNILIAAHALASRSILVTHDQALLKTPDLKVEDWTEAV
jgi:tRNA(fMet)-specific endonuclease VapC